MSGVKLVFIVALMSLPIVICSAPGGTTVKVDSKTLITTPAPTIRHGRIYVPITAFRKMGLYVDWKRGEHSGMVAWIDSDLIYDVTAGQSWVPGAMAGSKIELPGPPFMSGGQLMIPLRTPVIDMPRYRDFQIEWDSRNDTAIVHRSKGWLERRLKEDAVLKAAKPDCYETPI